MVLFLSGSSLGTVGRPTGPPRVRLLPECLSAFAHPTKLLGMLLPTLSLLHWHYHDTQVTIVSIPPAFTVDKLKPFLLHRSLQVFHLPHAVPLHIIPFWCQNTTLCSLPSITSYMRIRLFLGLLWLWHLLLQAPTVTEYSSCLRQKYSVYITLQQLWTQTTEGTCARTMHGPPFNWYTSKDTQTLTFKMDN